MVPTFGKHSPVWSSYFNNAKWSLHVHIISDLQNKLMTLSLVLSKFAEHSPCLYWPMFPQSCMILQWWHNKYHLNYYKLNCAFYNPSLQNLVKKVLPEEELKPLIKIMWSYNDVINSSVHVSLNLLFFTNPTIQIWRGL